MRNRVVVTGIGAVTPLGNDVPTFWEGLLAGRSGISPITAFEFGSRTEDPLSMYLVDVCTIPSNLAGAPGISVPIGLDGAGLPIGFQVMAPALGEETLFRVAAQVERGSGWDNRHPPMGEAERGV